MRGVPNLVTITVPEVPVLETPWVYPHPCLTLIAVHTPSALSGTAFITPATPRKQQKATLIYDSSEEEEGPHPPQEPSASTARHTGTLAAAATIGRPSATDKTPCGAAPPCSHCHATHLTR